MILLHDCQPVYGDPFGAPSAHPEAVQPQGRQSGGALLRVQHGQSGWGGGTREAEKTRIFSASFLCSKGGTAYPNATAAFRPFNTCATSSEMLCCLLYSTCPVLSQCKTAKVAGEVRLFNIKLSNSKIDARCFF